jgi:hypothetical protein
MCRWVYTGMEGYLGQEDAKGVFSCMVVEPVRAVLNGFAAIEPHKRVYLHSLAAVFKGRLLPFTRSVCVTVWYLHYFTHTSDFRQAERAMDYPFLLPRHHRCFHGSRLSSRYNLPP